jgi:hypothetical protein
LNKSKMASARVGTHGGKRDNSGRKRKYPGSENFSSQNKRVYLSFSVFLAWREAKTKLGTKDVATAISHPICCPWSIVEGKNTAE